ncbi:MAG: hypothetical protein QXN68_03555 [Thermoplasmata archaeon]
MIDVIKRLINRLKEDTEKCIHYVKEKISHMQEKSRYKMYVMSKKFKKLDDRIRYFYLKNEVNLSDLKKNVFYLDLSKDMVFNITDVIVGLRMMYILYRNDYNSAPIESIIRDYLKFLKENIDPLKVFNEPEDVYLMSYYTSLYTKYLFDTVSSVYAAQHWKEFVAKMVEFFDNFNRNVNYFYFFYVILGCNNFSYLIEDALRIMRKYYRCIVICSIYKNLSNKNVDFTKYKIKKIKLNKINKMNQFLKVFEMYNQGDYENIVKEFVVFKK